MHEFKLLAGSESDGVPDDHGAYALYMEGRDAELTERRKSLKVDEYERERFKRWKARAEALHMREGDNLFTAGRSDSFFSSLSPKERRRRCEDGDHHSAAAEQKELDALRRSRRKNGIFCECKALKEMSTTELRAAAERKGLSVHKKAKRGFIVNMIRSKVLRYRDVCCWDEAVCSCVAAGIECHSGGGCGGNEQCGCVRAGKKCDNKQGRYVYKAPRYAGALIEEWRECYDDMEGVAASKVAFQL